MRSRLDRDGKAKGVSFVDRKTGRAPWRVTAKAGRAGGRARARTARILLNSKSPKFPDGLSNTHGHGRPFT